MNKVSRIECHNRFELFSDHEQYYKAALAGLLILVFLIYLSLSDKTLSLYFILGGAFSVFYLYFSISFFSNLSAKEIEFEISDDGFKDTRVFDGIIPWNAICEIKPFGFGGYDTIVIVVLPDVIDRREPSLKLLINKFERKIMGTNPTIKIKTPGLSISSFELWMLLYKHHRASQLGERQI